MNGKKIACVVLMMILAGIAYGAQIMQKRAKDMMEEASIAKTDAEGAENNYKRVDYEIKYLKSKTQELRQFLKDWEPTIRRIQSTQEAEQALQSIVRNSHIITLSQKSDTRENRESKVVPKILQGSLIVQDEFTKTMNWLGELERKIPLMRVTSCRFKQGETGRHVNVELRFDIPIINRVAQLEETKPNG
jgi:hypothetical protein